jgi:hypothetical protein
MNSISKRKCVYVAWLAHRKRVLHKLARDLNLPKLTFQVIRRTIATLAQKKGTVKDVQGVLRHSRTATTTDVYMQEIPESVQATVNSIHSELRPKSASRGAQVWTAERRAQASLKSKERIDAKKISAGRRKRGKADVHQHPVLKEHLAICYQMLPRRGSECP